MPRARRFTSTLLPALTLIATGSAGLLLGCSEPEASTVPLGAYSYVAEMQGQDGGATTRFEGTLTVTKATEDELRVTWAVEGYDRREARGDRIPGTNRYVLYAYAPPDDGQIIRHFVSIGETSLPCEVQFFFDQTHNGTCTLTKD